MSHVHHWILERPELSWSLGRCKACKTVDAFPNHPKASDVISKREFLQLNNVAKPYTESEKMPVIKHALLNSIQEASKEFNIPTSTIGNWMKGKNPANKDKYSMAYKKKVVKEYQEKENFYQLAKDTGVPRSTLQLWVKIYA